MESVVGSGVRGIDEYLGIATAVAAAALSTEGVHSLGSGHYVEAATYGAGGKVVGVIVDSKKVEVHVVALYPPAPGNGSLVGLARKVGERVSGHTGVREVSVMVDDVEEVDES